MAAGCDVRFRCSSLSSRAETEAYRVRRRDVTSRPSTRGVDGRELGALESPAGDNAVVGDRGAGPPGDSEAGHPGPDGSHDQHARPDHQVVNAQAASRCCLWWPLACSCSGIQILPSRAAW